MGSKGSQTVTQSGNQTQTYTPNPAIGGAGGQAINMAQTAAGAPFQQPVAPVAPFTPFQSIGFGETLGLQGMAQPYFNTAGNYLAGSAAPVSGADVANYYNPMAENVTRQMQNIFGQQNVQNTGNLVQSAGGVGADRVAVGQANMANQQALAAGQTYAGLYQSALQAAQQQKQMEAGAGFAFGQMGPAAQAAQQNAVNQLLGVGAQQQGLNQQQLNAIYQNQLAQIAYPFQTGQYLAGITGGLAPAMGGTTTGQFNNQTTYPAPSGLAQALGLGAAGLGLMGQMGGIPGMSAMGLGAMGSMPFGSAMQYMPGGSAYGATPSYQNGGYYPMFGYDEGGAVDSNYGDLDRGIKYREFAQEIPAATRGSPIAETFLHDVGYDDGGQVIPVGEVVPFNQFHNTRTLQEAIDRIDNRKQPGAQGFAGAPPEAVESAHDTGVLKIHPLHGMDDGGSVDIPVGQASPMSLTIDPTNRGLNYPGAGKISGSPVPQMQLPQGQGGKSGPYGEYMFMHNAPSMPQGGGGQSPMGGGLGGLGQLGQLGGSIGKLMGGLGGSAGAAGAGAGVDYAGLTGDLGASIDEIGALLPLAAAAADGGAIDDAPTIGPGMPMAPKPSTPLPRQRPDVPKEYYPNGPWVHEFNPSPEWRQGQRRIASGGAVDPMHPGAGYGEDDVDPNDTGVGGFGHAISDFASQAEKYLGDKWRTMTLPPPGPGGFEGSGPTTQQPVPPERGSEPEGLAYGPARPPGKYGFDYPVEGVPFAPGRDIVPRGNIATPATPPQPPQIAGQKPSPYADLATMDQPFAVAKNLPQYGPTSADLPMDALGHGMGQPSSLALAGPQGAMGQPAAQSDMMPYRRATMVQETWLPGDKRGDPYQHVETTRNSRGMVQRALGAYGIMDFNLNDPNDDWGKQALGRHITPQELLAHPEYQDAIYDYKMRDYIKRFGVEGAGRVWLGGEGALNAPLRSDPLGGRVGPYGANFASLVRTGVGAPGGNTGVGQGMMTSGMRPSSNIEDYRDQGPMGSSAPRNVPFPNAADPNSVARRWMMSPWAALTNAGVAMATSRGPIGSVLATGIGAAGKTFAGQQQELNSEQAINDKAEQLAILADAHLRSYSQMTAAQKASHEETVRYHDIIANLRGSSVWNTARAKLEAEPAWMGRSEEDKDVEAARRISEGMQAQQHGQGPPRPPGTPDNAQYSQKSGTWWTPDGKEWGKPESAGAG